MDGAAYSCSVPVAQVKYLWDLSVIPYSQEVDKKKKKHFEFVETTRLELKHYLNKQVWQ